MRIGSFHVCLTHRFDRKWNLSDQFKEFSSRFWILRRRKIIAARKEDERSKWIEESEQLNSKVTGNATPTGIGELAKLSRHGARIIFFLFVILLIFFFLFFSFLIFFYLGHNSCWWASHIHEISFHLFSLILFLLFNSAKETNKNRTHSIPALPKCAALTESLSAPEMQKFLNEKYR